MKYKVGEHFGGWEDLKPFDEETILDKGTLAVLMRDERKGLPLGTVVQIDESNVTNPYLLPKYPNGDRPVRHSHNLAPLPQAYEAGDFYENWEKLEPLPEDRVVEGEGRDLFVLIKSHSDVEAGRILSLHEVGSICPYMMGWEDGERCYIPNSSYLAPLPKEERDSSKNQNTKTFINSKPQNTMNTEGKTLSEQYLSALIEEPQKTFIDLGITHQNGNLTEDGQVLFLNYLFKANTEEFNESVVQVIKDSQKKVS